VEGLKTRRAWCEAVEAVVVKRVFRQASIADAAGDIVCLAIEAAEDKVAIRSKAHWSTLAHRVVARTNPVEAIVFVGGSGEFKGWRVQTLEVMELQALRV